MQGEKLPKKRNTGWARDGREKGVYHRHDRRLWGYYDRQLGRVVQVEGDRRAAIDARDESRERVRKGLPAPDRKVTVCDLAEVAREAKRRKLKDSSLEIWEQALDKIILPELGHLKPIQIGPERLAKLYRDLESGKITGNPLTGGSAERYVAPLKDIMRRALRAGATPTNPFELLDEDDRPSNTGRVREHYAWSPEEISALISAATRRAEEKASRYDYAPLIHLLVLTGVRVSEALALRVQDVDLLIAAELHIRHSWSRKGELDTPKTKTSAREVPLKPGLVEMLARVIPADADPEHFVFHARSNRWKPISYWNFRRRGFAPALKDAGLAGKGITIHSLRSAAISIYAASGLTMLETATVMGQKDPQVTWKHYARLFDRSKVNERIRAAQESIEL